MRRPVTMIVIGLFLAQSAGAQPALGPVGCVSLDELQAESVVRTGVDLREILKSCAARNYADGPALASTSLQAFRNFDQTYGKEIKDALAVRQRVLDRNFPGRGDAEQQIDAAIISIYEGRYMTDGECKAAMQVMRGIELGGWKAFIQQVDIMRKKLEPFVMDCRNKPRK